MKDYLVCTNCGGKDKFLEKEKGKLVCLYCGSIIVEKEDENKYQELLESINNQSDSLIDKMDQQEKKLIANAICNLRAEIDKQFPDNKLLLSYAKEVKKYIPNHFLANVLELLSSKQYVQLNEYLSSYDYREISQELLEYVIKKLIENIESSIELTIATMIESYVIDDNTKTILFTDYEKELDKLNKATYECSFPRDIFVAHSSKDNKEALEIVNYLEGMGYTCWVSTRNLRHGVNAKATYDDSIKAAIDNCTIFLLIGSDNSRNRVCDAYEIEMKYLYSKDEENQPIENKNLDNSQWDIKYKKRRVQYMLTSYSKNMNAFEKYTKNLFKGFQNCTNKEQLAKVIEDLRSNKIITIEEPLTPTIKIETINYPNGDVYEGEWKDRKFLGTNVEDKKEIVKEENNVSKDNITKATITTKKETIKYPNGDVYEGETLNGEKHGHGIYKWPNGEICEGEWKDGKQSGHVICKWPNGCIFEGEWKDDIFNGYGVMKWADGDVYEGEWKDGKRNGQGIYKYADGDWLGRKEYNGEWKDGKRNGHGVMKYADGRVYEGEWKDGKQNGHGTLTLADGKKQECEWKDGKFLGTKVEDKKEVVKEDNNNIEVVTITTKKETIKYPNGDVYEGETLNGEKHGHGIYKWPNGEICEGEWKDGKQSGHVIYKWPNGCIFEGEYKNGERNGHGVMKYADGDVYEGEWKDDRPHGLGELRFSNGDIYESKWQQGISNGCVKITYADGTIFKGRINIYYKPNLHGTITIPNEKGIIHEYNLNDLDKKNSFLMSYANGDTYQDLWNLSFVKNKIINDFMSYVKKDNSIEFGSYPQTKVTDTTLISTLNKKAGTLPTSKNSNQWTSYKYYTKNKQKDYMWYIDIEECGIKYRGVYFTKHRPFKTTEKCYDFLAEHCNYNTNTMYWFKYEPIKWSILEESNGYAMLISDMAIDAQDFYCSDNPYKHNHNGGRGYSNNYALSSIRKWLNETFYKTAFNEVQKTIIQTTEVDNSESLTNNTEKKYVCENTYDKVYLLSYKQINHDHVQNRKKCTDYAQSNANHLHDFHPSLTRDWWTRTPGRSGRSATCITDNGYWDSLCTNITYAGVVPVLKIKL